MRKNGFTLAEVLITLAIIGIVAALTIPTLMTDSRLQLVSSRISKFVSTTEDAALAYAAMNGTIENMDQLDDIILYKSKKEVESGMFYELKDGTRLVTNNINDETQNIIRLPILYRDSKKYGDAIGMLIFFHNVSGINNLREDLAFTITNKGYVFPLAGDACTNALFNPEENNKKAPWKITKEMIKQGGACYGG